MGSRAGRWEAVWWQCPVTLLGGSWSSGPVGPWETVGTMGTTIAAASPEDQGAEPFTTRSRPSSVEDAAGDAGPLALCPVQGGLRRGGGPPGARGKQI